MTHYPTHIRGVRRPPVIGRRALIVGLLLVGWALFPAGLRAADRHAVDLYQQKHSELHQSFVASLEELAQFCEEQQLDDAAREVRQAGRAVDSNVLRVEALAGKLQAEIPAALPADERRWRTHLRRLRQEHAKQLYLLSRRTLGAGHVSFAYRLVREVVHYDPDHTAARRLLGHVQYGDEWLSPFAADMKRRNYEWHDSFGWLPSSHVARYENGQRHFRNRWMTAAQEAEYRRDFRFAWEIRTEHYLVRTNHSLERGVEIARKLEDFHEVFYQTFAAFFNTPEQLQQLLAGPRVGTRSVARPRLHEVHYYRTREEYNDRLRQKIPQIEITNGLYYTSDRVAYFFHDPQENNDATIYHEGTHQLFYESSPHQRAIAEKEHFWIIEGIACYMESFQQEADGFSLGDPDYIRFEAARYRYLIDSYYVPLLPFTEMGLQEFQHDPNIQRNYSQASGLAHFFMQFDQGLYRDALIEHLSQLYTANTRKRLQPQSLAELTGVGYEKLDEQYGQYLKDVAISLSEDFPGRN